jgi:hypothetical protein
MSALGTADPEEGLRRLREALGRLGRGERQTALAVDLGVRLDEYFGREPTDRECDWLGERRDTFASLIGREAKTVSRWSDAALADLRALLINDSFNGHLYVVAAVDEDHIAGISLIREPLNSAEGGVIGRETIEMPNASGGPSLPVLAYALPRDWMPASLRLAVVFRSGPRPTLVEAFFTRSLVELPYLGNRTPISLDGDTATAEFQPPRREWLYGIAWSG